MGAHSFATLQHVIQAVAHREVTPGLVDVFLSLFDGHDIPALYWARDRRPGFYQSPGTNRALIWEAHLLGAVLAGSYPFRGVIAGCGCAEREHTCAGRGCFYLCIDLDAKNGEKDIRERVSRLLRVAWRLGLLPVVFSSRSGKGAHVYIFLSEVVSTRQAHAAGVALAKAAGIMDRCDVIPSAEHDAGLGTLHALPCSPMAEPGGGVLFDAMMRPVGDPRTVVSSLQWVDQHRSPAHVIRDLAKGTIELPQFDTVVRAVPHVVERTVTALDRTAEATPTDPAILRSIRRKHPQFKRALATPSESWRGKRSSRDSYLVSYMRRQGMSGAGIVDAMMILPGTKAVERGADYVWAMLESQGRERPEHVVMLAGQTVRPAEAKVISRAVPDAPWAARVPPPKHYEGQASPWWSEPVQNRLADARSKLDGLLLAYLIDRYYRGPVPRRMFYISVRGLGRVLGFPAATVGLGLHRLSERFPDVLRIVAGVSHPVLRIANGFYVPERGHADAIDWYMPAQVVV